ncbi:PREDICTED: XIAP-associated factor 1 [Chrysochloris asiatica]|uniref:XIAP-associated factor 1 n=1 Tax=Chrysochloris asiatica TaxID=185453 RepID=A0A9B0TN59_CHRAS|nr:PREDICTED: XIAP-associated factor 1 [Chrysochloris asiatica]
MEGDGQTSERDGQTLEEDVQVCQYCKRNVASAHFTLHEVHCMRFLVICQECEEPVPKKEMEEHLEDKHKEVECTMCHQNVQKYLLDAHETKDCQMRQVNCKFCELTMGLSKLVNHEYQCGSRTERCPHCNQLILLRKLAHHKDNCQGKQTHPRKGKRMPTVVKKIKCNACDQAIPIKEFVHHIPRNVPSSRPSQSATYQTSTVENDVRPKIKKLYRSPFLFENSARQTPRGKKKPMDLPLKSEFKTRATSPTRDEAAYNVLKKCSWCDILLPLPTLSRHQEKCQWLVSSKRKYMRYSS